MDRNLFFFLLFGANFVWVGILVFVYLRYSRLREVFVRKSAIPVAPAKPKVSVCEQEIVYQEETAFLFKLSEQISRHLTRSDIARHICIEVHKFLNVGSCVLLLANKDNSRLQCEFSIGLEPPLPEDFFLSPGASISGNVFTNKRPLVIADVNNDLYYRAMNKEPYIKKSFVSVPMCIENNALGVLNVCDKKNGAAFLKREIDFLVNISRVGAVAFESARLHDQIREDSVKTITALALLLDARDAYTRWHSENVARYAHAIACEMKFPLRHCEIIRRAALLHDIGKIAIKDNILLKPEPLTPDEFAQIKIHPVKGADILASLPFLREEAALIRYHHEGFDGHGYPDGLKGSRIEPGSRILAVADSFDAMTSDRPYRKALSIDIASQELLKCKGCQFDPDVVDAFLRILSANPGIMTHV